MPKYRFKDNEMKFSDIMNIFEEFEDTYTEAINSEKTSNLTFIEYLHAIIIDCNEDIKMSDIEMYDEEKNGAIVFLIRSKYKCLRTIAHTKFEILKLFSEYSFNLYLEFSLYKLANVYLEALEYFFTYSYMVRDESKQKINSKFGYFDTDMAYNFKQSLVIPCDGEDTGV